MLWRRELSIPASRFPFALAAVCCVVAVTSAVALSRPLRSRVVRAVHGSRARVGALWGGSLAFALLHAAVLIAAVRALDVALPAGQVLLAYLVASGAAALLPTPGGLGSLDAALALTAAGASGSMSVSAVLGYRPPGCRWCPACWCWGCWPGVRCSEPDRCRQRDAHRGRRTLAGSGGSMAVSLPWWG
ncbi:hypothetical protein GCM10027162_20760 [Streptomyces incanus]